MDHPGDPEALTIGSGQSTLSPPFINPYMAGCFVLVAQGLVATGKMIVSGRVTGLQVQNTLEMFYGALAKAFTAKSEGKIEMALNVVRLVFQELPVTSNRLF